MFNAMAQKVKDAQSSDDDEQENSPSLVDQHNSILDNLMLAEEHLVFMFSSIDPGVKCSENVASVNVAKVTSSIITAIMISLRDLLPMVGLEIGMATSDAAGCNWVSFRDTLSMVFWGCSTDGWRQHQQVDSSRIRPCGQEGKYIQCSQIFSCR